MSYYLAGLAGALTIGLLSVLFLPGIIAWVPASKFIRADLGQEWILEKKANVGDNWIAEVTITIATIEENGLKQIENPDCQGVYYSQDRNFRVVGPCADVSITIGKAPTRAAPSFSV